LQALAAVDAGPGDVVVVHAAAGGTGHFAVQLARALGAARVIGTASPADHDFLRSLGAEPVEYGADLPDGEQPESLGELSEAGRLRVEVSREFPLEGVAEAHRLLESGHARGKIVPTVA
jgi:NADPH:quinone reductase-like Zn-dependent oxidoreductase